MWKDLDPSKKAKYEENAAREKEAYQKKLAAYKETDSYAQFQLTLTQFKKDKKKSGAKSAGKFRKDPNMPKKAQTGFFLFMAENRSKYHVEGQRSAVTITKVSDVWKALSDAEKAPYLSRAEAAKKEHAVKVEKYMQSAERKAYEQEKKEFE